MADMWSEDELREYVAGLPDEVKMSGVVIERKRFTERGKRLLDSGDVEWVFPLGPSDVKNPVAYLFRES